MRESFGGAFMLKLVLIFIIIYVSFMAMAITYAKAFRVKNGVIDILERYQYEGASDYGSVEEPLETYLNAIPYHERSDSTVNYCDKEAKKEGKTYVVNSNGVCIIDMSTNNEYGYYKVITYISIKDFPFFDINVIFPISGETKTIYY